MSVPDLSGLAGLPGLPGLPGAVVTVSCPGGVLGATVGAGLGAACQAASSVGAAAGSVVGHAAGAGATQVLDALGGWVASGAVWLLGRVAGLLVASTRVDLGATWFTSHLAVMVGLSGTVVLPLLALGVVQAIHAQSAVLLVRTALVNVPAALVLTGVAVKLVAIGLVVTDAMSTAVAGGARAETSHVLGRVVLDLGTAALGGQAGVPEFLVLVASVVVVAATFAVWVELLLRAAALYVAVLFLPLALASLAWPAVSHWSRRLAEAIAALVLAKFVVVAVLSLGAGAVAAGTGGTSSGAANLTAVLAGASLLLLASLSPWALLRLLPFAEAGAVAHLDGVANRGVRAVAGAPRTLVRAALGMSEVAGALASNGAGQLGGTLGSVGGAAARAAGATAGAGVHPASTWARTGVGAGRVPGDDIPMWAPHPGASAALHDALAAADAGGAPGVGGAASAGGAPGVGGATSAEGAASAGLGPGLPEAGAAGEATTSGHRWPVAGSGGPPPGRGGGAPNAWIARDHLGPVLVSTGPWPPLDGEGPTPGGPPGGTLPVWAGGTGGEPGPEEDGVDDGLG